MIEMVRHCPDCGRDTLFEQYHTEPDRCPDSLDGCCPEWFCAACGAALIIAGVSLEYDWAGVADVRGRVA